MSLEILIYVASCFTIITIIEEFYVVFITRELFLPRASLDIPGETFEDTKMATASENIMHKYTPRIGTTPLVVDGPQERLASSVETDAQAEADPRVEISQVVTAPSFEPAPQAQLTPAAHKAECPPEANQADSRRELTLSTWTPAYKIRTLVSLSNGTVTDSTLSAVGYPSIFTSLRSANLAACSWFLAFAKPNSLSSSPKSPSSTIPSDEKAKIQHEDQKREYDDLLDKLGRRVQAWNTHGGCFGVKFRVGRRNLRWLKKEMGVRVVQVEVREWRGEGGRWGELGEDSWEAVVVRRD